MRLARTALSLNFRRSRMPKAAVAMLDTMRTTVLMELTALWDTKFVRLRAVPRVTARDPRNPITNMVVSNSSDLSASFSTVSSTF